MPGRSKTRPVLEKADDLQEPEQDPADTSVDATAEDAPSDIGSKLRAGGVKLCFHLACSKSEKNFSSA